MKRSRSIKLVLLGTLATGAFHACEPNSPSSGFASGLSTANIYTNDHYVAGAGYYHAPFRAWYPMPYNTYDGTRKMYYYGGQWWPTPHQSIVNLSSPTDEAIRLAEATRTDVPRSGFGRTSRSTSVWS
jgi:hypothetical protein